MTALLNNRSNSYGCDHVLKYVQYSLNYNMQIRKKK